MADIGVYYNSRVLDKSSHHKLTIDAGSITMPIRNPIVCVLLGLCALVVYTGCDVHATRTVGARERLAKARARTKVSVAQELFDYGKINEASNLVDQSLENNPEIPEAHLLKGRIYLLQGKLGEARESIRVALMLDSDLQQAHELLELIAQQSSQQALGDPMTKPIALNSASKRGVWALMN